MKHYRDDENIIKKKTHSHKLLNVFSQEYFVFHFLKQKLLNTVLMILISNSYENNNNNIRVTPFEFLTIN